MLNCPNNSTYKFKSFQSHLINQFTNYNRVLDTYNSEDNDDVYVMLDWTNVLKINDRRVVKGVNLVYIIFICNAKEARLL